MRADERGAAVEAEMTYVVPGPEKLFSVNYEPRPPGMPERSGEYRTYRVAIHDAWPIAGRLSLDRQGFELRQHRSAVQDFFDDDEVRRVHYPEIAQLLRQATGAAHVLVFDHTLRSSARRSGIREPVVRVHNDYTLKSGPQRARDFLSPEDAERLLKHRYAEINVWRPIRGPLLRLPLAICDGSTLQLSDFHANELIFRDRVGEIFMVAYSPRHRWYYVPEMQRDEVLLFKCYDSAEDVVRFSAHSAFEHPATPADAPPRESIEMRAYVFFAPG